MRLILYSINPLTYNLENDRSLMSNNQKCKQMKIADSAQSLFMRNNEICNILTSFASHSYGLSDNHFPTLNVNILFSVRYNNNLFSIDVNIIN